jgi:predicted glycosyltransferase
MLHPDHLTPEALSSWLYEPERGPAGAFGRIDFGGVARLPALLAEMLEPEAIDKDAVHATG